MKKIDTLKGVELNHCSNDISNIIASGNLQASAPCRIDMGGTLDISTFFYPLQYLDPCTFNIAIDLRTRVRLLPYAAGMVKITSRGFKSAEYPLDNAPFNHPLGLMFAIAAYFRVEGVHIDIDSSSPPRSALGGSSAAAVALVALFCDVLNKMGQGRKVSKQTVAALAFDLEESVAGVPCGRQDQLAATYGGVNAWYWRANGHGPVYRKKVIIKKKAQKALGKHLLVAYCGIPHESKNVNNKWVQQFIKGQKRQYWADIVECTHKFVTALTEQNYREASVWMNHETKLRREMTPEVVDGVGNALMRAAIENNCGSRFTGAGGGGCIWAIGGIEDIRKLKKTWQTVLDTVKDGCLLDVKIDSSGLKLHD